MASIARVSVSRNNNSPKPRFSQSQPNLATAGAPRGVSTFFLDNVGAVDTYAHHLPFVFHDEYGVSPFALAPVERMMMKQGKKKPSLDVDSSDDEWEEADVKGKQLSTVKRDDEALYFKMDMPGVGKEDAKLYLEGCTLMAKGVRKSDPQFDDGKDARETCSAKTYSAAVSLMPMHKYKIDGLKAEMKNGVLKVTVPKVKDEERTDVMNFQID